MRTNLVVVLLGLLTAAVFAEPRTLSGKLVIPPEAGTKKSYWTGNFQLVTKDARLILTPSARVSEEQLKAFQNRIVTVEVKAHPAQPADPMEQAPMVPGSPGGALQEHPAYFEVVRIRPYR